ncbi:MAG TPA: PhzF family phenazine biosynthesis protein [Bacteroidia bacterium]|nr:PhzF family phenazine biosynthesis protein [Bacteroidia bacterium]
MKLRIYLLDAFAEKLFSGNPAAVCPLDSWLSDDMMKSIAMENNLAETAFYIKEGDNYLIRWFTPAPLEVDLCGHATLAAAHVLFNFEGHKGDEISFNSRSGLLKVKKSGDSLTLDFPADEYEREKTPGELSIALNITTKECYKGKTDYMLVYENEDQIIQLKPNFTAMKLVDCRGIICTAKGKTADFVSRFFAPQAGINEDPVTGSAHTTLTPYWSGVLGKKEMNAVQLSARRGYLKCVDKGSRVEISGKVKTYLKGEIEI